MAKITKPSDIPQEVPMFLRKTYHMIDSCDSKVACWSDDGETFIVKDPVKFEREVIPQFFKHSKFTSFVRQLNFYSFRKIKYMDTLRLDPKLEAETANFWRFRHEKFQRGKPHLLTSIKRMTAAQSRAAASTTTATTKQQQKDNDKVTPTTVVSSSSSSPSPAVDDNTNNSDTIKSEIDTLKKQLEEMNKNMNELTNMVQRVSLTEQQTKEETSAVGNKRKKLDTILPPESISSCNELLPDASLDLFMGSNSNSDDDDMMVAPCDDDATYLDHVTSYPLEAPQAFIRATSLSSSTTDSDFVDQLFSAFEQDLEGDDARYNMDDTDLPQPAWVESSVSSSRLPFKERSNHPDPELMDRLSEALAVLPKNMQEQIVNRLIDSIMSNAVPVTATKAVVVSSKHDDDEEFPQAVVAPSPDFAMPLAAATLASLLSYYSNLIKNNQTNNNNNAMEDEKPAKTIPVIPCHA